MQRSLQVRSSLQFPTPSQNVNVHNANKSPFEPTFSNSQNVDVSASNPDFRPQAILQSNYSLNSTKENANFFKTSSAESYQTWQRGSGDYIGSQSQFSTYTGGELRNDSMIMMSGASQQFSDMEGKNGSRVVQTPDEPKKRPTLKLTNQERGFYSSLLFQIDPVGNNKTPANLAATLLRASGLPISDLKKIWLIASASSRDYLERDEFYIALKLISYAQNGVEVSMDSILKNIPSPLPVFENLPKPDFKAENMKNKENIYELTPELIAKYNNYFEISDTDKMGEIKGIDAKSVFERSNLPRETLMKIWVLSDAKRKGSLNRAEFIIAVHLISTAKRGYPIPELLPESLASYKKEFEEKESKKSVSGTKVLRSQSLQPSPNLESNSRFLSPPSKMEANQFAFSNANEPANDEPFKDQTPSNIIKRDESRGRDSTEDAPQQRSRKNSQASESQSARSSISELTQEKEAADPTALNTIPPGKKDSTESAGEIEKVNKQLTSVKDRVNESQKNLSMELSTIREFHSKILTEKTLELNFLMGMVENYQKISKKLKDEKSYLIEEMKKIEDKKISAKKMLLAVQEGIMRDLEENKGLRETLIKKAGDSISEISSIAQNVLDLKDEQSRRKNVIPEQEESPERIIRKNSGAVNDGKFQTIPDNHFYNPFNN